MFHFQNDKVVKTDEECCKKQDLINNGLNVCRQCGQVINYEFVPGYCYLSNKKNKKKSVLRRKYYVNKVLNTTIDKHNITLSYNEIDEFYRLFQIVEHQMVQMKIKRFVKFN